MSERTPLLSGSINGPSTSSLPSTRDVRNALPSKGQRIRVAEASGALAAGKLPSQDQLSKMIDLIVNADTLKPSGGANSRTARLGSEGQRVLENVKAVLSSSKAWGEDKNGDDLLQNLFYNASTADVDIDIKTVSPTSKASMKEMSKDAQRAIESFRSIASLVVTNDNFRQIGSDIILLTRDIFADAASVAADSAKQAAEASRPSESERKKGVDFKDIKNKGKEHARHLATGKYQAEVKESIWDEVENLRDYVDEKLPAGEEAREKMISKLREVIVQAQSNPEYRRSLTAISGLFKKYASKAEEAFDETVEKSKVSDEDEKVQQAGRDLKTFVERVSNKSLDDVIKAIQDAANDIKEDEKLSAYFKDLDAYVDRLLYQPGYVASQAAYRKASSLYDDAQSLIAENEKWKKDAAELQKQLEGVVTGVKNDGPTNQLVESIQELGDSLATAGKIGLGSLKVDGQGLYRDLLDVVLPRVIGLVKEIPVPRIEFKSEDVDLVIDDFNFESASFIPDSVRLVSHGDLRFTQGYATYASEYDATMRLRVEGIHFEASNIAFWVNRKGGFWPFEDAGLLDFKFGPDGIDFDVTLENADEDDTETFFKVKKVDVKINDFDFTISKNYRWFATWFAQPFLKAFIKRSMASALESQMAEYLYTADFKLFALQQRAIAATNAKPSPMNFVNAIVNDTIFPKSSSNVKLGSKGIVKYGRHGEYLLHIGVDDDLFPNQPPPQLRNPQRQKAKAAAKQVEHQAKRAIGAADSFSGAANKVAGDAKKEANELSARAQEKQKRENRKEGWRTDAFDL